MDLVSFYQELVRSPSVFGEEHQSTLIVERALQQLRVPVSSVAFDPSALSRLKTAQRPFCAVPNRRNLIAQVKGKGGGRSLILNCHLDVVPAGDPSEWDDAPFSGKIVDGYLYGRGAYDDKAGAAICIGVIESVMSENLSGDLTIHFVLEDETTGNGTLLCLENGPHADAAIIVDGTRGERGINQHAGNIKVRLVSFGKPASVSVSHMGLNAAEILAGTCLALKSAVLDLNKSVQSPWSQFPSPNQISTIALTCEEAALTVPARAEATLYATFTPEHTIESFTSMVRNIAEKTSRELGAEQRPEIYIEFAAEPVGSRSDELESAISRAVGHNIPFGPSTGTSDMRHFIDRKIPCVLFGPGRGYNPHRANESFEVKSLGETVNVLSSVARGWCK